MDRERLLACIREGKTMHALLIAGPAGSGRAALARAAAAAFLADALGPGGLAACPDYQELAAPYAVEQIRALTESLAAQPFGHGRRAYALLDAHGMNASCQNALLKSLEEPPEDTLLVLAGNEPGLLPTVRSRCAIVRLGAQPMETAAQALADEGIDPARAAVAAAWADGVTSLARAYAADEYAAFRAAAAACLEAALFGGTPFPATAALLRAPVQPARGRQKQEAVNAPLLLQAWQSILRDALLLRTGGAPAQNPDQKKLAGRIAARFTTAQIQGIIEMLGDGLKRLAFGASGSMTVDAVLASLNEEEKERR